MAAKSEQDDLAHAIFLQGLESSQHSDFINTSDLTEAILGNRRNAKVWLYTRGKSQWKADIWIKCLLATKLAELSYDAEDRLFMHATLEIPKSFAAAARRYAVAHVFTRNRPFRWWASAPESERLTGQDSSEILEGKQIDEKIAGDSGA